MRPEDLTDWVPIPGYEGFYEVSSQGHIRSLDRDRQNGTGVLKGRVLKGRPNDTGYLIVALYDRNGGRKDKTIHSIILETFVGIRPSGLQCRHLDGNSQNNSLSNLCWGTSLEQANDRKRHGTGHREMSRKGEAISWSKFTEKDIRDIRRKYKEGATQGTLAKEYGVHQSYISRIVLKVVWSHVVED